MRRPHHRPLAIGLIVLAAAAAGCSNDSPSAAERERAAVAREQARIRRENRENPPPPPPLIPFEVGQRAGLGRWQLVVDGFEIGPTTTVRATITNTRTTGVPAPTAFELRDGAAPSSAPQSVIVPSSIDGLPATLAPRTPTAFTIRFATPDPPAAPLLFWNGDAVGSFDAVFRLGDPPPPEE